MPKTGVASYTSALAWDAQKGYVNNIGRSADSTPTVLIMPNTHVAALALTSEVHKSAPRADIIGKLGSPGGKMRNSHLRPYHIVKSGRVNPFIVFNDELVIL